MKKSFLIVLIVIFCGSIANASTLVLKNASKFGYVKTQDKY